MFLTIIEPKPTNLFSKSEDALSFVPGGFFGYAENHKKNGETLPLMVRVEIEAVQELVYETGDLLHDQTQRKWRKIKDADWTPPQVTAALGSGGD